MHIQSIALMLFSLLPGLGFTTFAGLPQREPHGRRNGLPDLFAESSCRAEQTSAGTRQFVVLVIRNKGTALAGASITKVQFNIGTAKHTVEVKTPLLWQGGSYEHKIDIPAGCFDPDCGFDITVDPSNYVRESNEVNNISHQNCLG